MKCPKCQSENSDTVKFCGECGTNITSADEVLPSFTKTLETPVESLTRGTLFAGRYEIIEELGRGGMGAVYRVEDTKIQEEVALKLIRPEISSDKKTIERFHNELKIARKIRHKNVSGMFDLSEDKGTHFITMEYVPGQDLKSLIRQTGRLAMSTALSIAKHICEGVDEAHSHGVVHRDLKPSNVIIDKEGTGRILDFGIARSLRARGITGEGVMIGTPEYMSPEQAEAKDVDERSDIYSLGVILYEMVTGQLPFEGETPLSIAMKHKGEVPRDPKVLNPLIPDDLRRVIMKCLEKDREKRCQSAGELRSELEAIEKGIPTTLQDAERKPFTSKEITVQLSMKKLLIPALIVVAVAVTGLIFWKMLPREKATQFFPSDKPSVAVMFFANQTGDEDLDHWREALPIWLITVLSQSKYLNVLPLERIFSIHSKLDLLEANNYSSEDLMNVAREGRVSHIFQASFTQAGDIFRIDYTLQKSDTLENIASDYVTGKSEESFPSLVDDITRKIKTNLELSAEQVESDIDRNAETISTSSPEAFKYFSIGRKFHLQGEYRKAIELFEKALAIDQEFGAAYSYMGASYANLSYRTKVKGLWQKALEFKDKLSDRRRYMVEGNLYSQSEATWDKSIEAYKNVLEIYPDHSAARNNLALRYRYLEEYRKAIDHYETCITKYGYDFIRAYNTLAVCYRNLGLFDKAIEANEKWLNNFPDNTSVHRSLATTYRYQGKFDLALEEMDKAFTLAPTSWTNLRTKGDLYLYMGDFKRTEEEYRKLLEKEESVANYWGTHRLGLLFRLQGRFKESIEWHKKGMERAEEQGEKRWINDQHLNLSDMDILLGNPEEALKKFDLVWDSVVEDEDFSRQRRILNARGLAFLELNQIADAQRTAEELRELIEQGINKNHFRLYYHLLGRIEMEKDSYTEAIEFFNQGEPFLISHTSDLRMIYADSVGLAFFKSGNLEKAREEYERIDSLPGRLEYGDIYAKSFYMLGKIYEQQGDTAKAIEHYEIFLDLWKDADPFLPELADARERVAGLR